MASNGPASTQSCSPFTAARSQPSRRNSASADSGSDTAVIAPAASVCIRRPRAATMCSASSSENTPDRQAATYSPRLWPSISAGCTPQLIHQRAIAYSTANSAGCAYAMRNSRSFAAASSPSAGNTSASRSMPQPAFSSAAQRSSSSRNTALR